jgi:phosphoadenosine phosphosulfate reductase
MHAQLIDRYGDFDGIDLLEPLLNRRFKDRVALVSSFGSESAVLLHMVAEINPHVPVIFLETGKLFWETLSYRSMLVDRLGLTDIRNVKPDGQDLATHDPRGDLHLADPDFCCHIRKTEPLQKALEGFDAWISGRKRYHGGNRARIPAIETSDGKVKIEPLARFTARDIAAYMAHYDLPQHPLVAQGYRSIGCVPCTMKGGTADNPRAGRWAGLNKTECGIHFTQNGRPIRLQG